MRSTTHGSESRHIIFCGETGSGESSVINLLLKAGDARISNGSRTYTQVTSSSVCYEISLYGLNYCLWDTRGLSGGRSFFQNILGGGSVKNLKKFLKERHRDREIDLLVYCIHGSRPLKALAKAYGNFCAISRRLAAPVAIVVTGLEKEHNVEDWWRRNASALRRLKMDFDDHACITTLPGPHLAKSKEKLMDLIARNHHWEPKECGSYFGLPAQTSTRWPRSVPPLRMIWNYLKLFHRGNVDDRSSEFSTQENEGFLSDLHIRDLTKTIRRRNDFSTHSGAFGDIWECDLHSGGSSRKVAVKAIKTKSEELGSHRRKLHRELNIWWRLQHRNTVPLLGVVSGFGRLPSPVSPWFSNGSLSSYLTVHHTLRTSERRRLLRDIAAGLCYLHSQDIVHGDLHSGNVLIDDDGTACLTDFGLSLVNGFVRTSYSMSGICGNVVFTDPALVKRAHDGWDIFYPTKPCDVYSFGGLMLHVLSGRRPYDGIPSISIFLTVINGERPQIPTNIDPQDVSVMQGCWNLEEDNRPSVDDLVQIFED